MSKLYTIVFLLFLSVSVKSQALDTLLIENFQFDPFASIPIVPAGNDSGWVNYDQDNLPCILDTDASKRWLWGEFFTEPTDPITGEVNYCAISYSYLLNSALGNRNWLMLPPITVTDNSYSLSWRSSPSQLPRYMDGYQVMASTTGNHVADFVDSLFVAASMASISGNGQSTNFSNFIFTPGYIHANSCQIAAYYIAGSSINYGKLEPHTISLSAYAGKTVYLAFLHNSDDDDRLALDDIVVTKALSSSITEALSGDLKAQLSPNPASTLLNLSFVLPHAMEVSYSIINQMGQTLQVQNLGNKQEGQNSIQLSLEGLNTGCYFLKLKSESGIQVKPFVKQ